jgi:putative transposase
MVKYKLDRGNHNVYSLYYHLIFVTKYRRKALYDEEIRERLKQIVYDLSEKLSIEIVAQEPGDDHHHVLFKATPSTDLVRVVNTIKGASSKRLRSEFPKTKQYLWGDSFWSDSYFIASTGQVSIDVLVQYVQSQPDKIPSEGSPAV